jgi:hypothetical protein
MFQAGRFLGRNLVTIAALGVAVSTAQADIVYDVNLQVGAGSVTGFIQTDGFLGTLPFTAPSLAGPATHIIDFQLTLNNGFHTVTISHATVAYGSDMGFPFLVFTDNALQFTFNFIPGPILMNQFGFYQNSADLFFDAIGGDTGPLIGQQSMGIVIPGDPVVATYFPHGGTIDIGVVAVPAPALGSGFPGLLLLIMALRRRCTNFRPCFSTPSIHARLSRYVEKRFRQRWSRPFQMC